MNEMYYNERMYTRRYGRFLVIGYYDLVNHRITKLTIVDDKNELHIMDATEGFKIRQRLTSAFKMFVESQESSKDRPE